MAKFYGKVGFTMTKEVPVGSGILVDDPIERTYYGDILNNRRKWSQSGNVNDNIDISTQFSIVADNFAVQNTHNMKYVVWNGAKWKISTADIQYPRIIIDVGGVYNG